MPLLLLPYRPKGVSSRRDLMVHLDDDVDVLQTDHMRFHAATVAEILGLGDSQLATRRHVSQRHRCIWMSMSRSSTSSDKLTEGRQPGPLDEFVNECGLHQLMMACSCPRRVRIFRMWLDDAIERILLSNELRVASMRESSTPCVFVATSESMSAENVVMLAATRDNLADRLAVISDELQEPWYAIYACATDRPDELLLASRHALNDHLFSNTTYFRMPCWSQRRWSLFFKQIDPMIRTMDRRGRFCCEDS